MVAMLTAIISWRITFYHKFSISSRFAKG
jgi:hypothetical protein